MIMIGKSLFLSLYASFEYQISLLHYQCICFDLNQIWGTTTTSI